MLYFLQLSNIWSFFLKKIKSDTNYLLNVALYYKYSLKSNQIKLLFREKEFGERMRSRRRRGFSPNSARKICGSATLKTII